MKDDTQLTHDEEVEGVSGLFLFIFVLCLFYCCSATAQSDVLHFKTITFENANDLGLRVQRIEAVVDTVLDFADPFIYCCYKGEVDTTYREIITRREVVEVVATKEAAKETMYVPDEKYPQAYFKGKPVRSVTKAVIKIIPGVAVVWWREIKD